MIKIAIYYDWLNTWGGAEKVLLNLLTIFPQAELFTLFYDKKNTPWLPKNIKIHTSFLQSLPRTNFLAPIYDIAAENFNLKKLTSLGLSFLDLILYFTLHKPLL